MRVLTTAKQDELLKRIAACQIIVNNIKGIDPNFYATLGEHFANMAYDIGGIEGITKVKNTAFGWNKEE